MELLRCFWPPEQSEGCGRGVNVQHRGDAGAARREDLPQYQAIALDLVHQVLTDQAKKLILLISGTNGAYQVAN